MRMNVYSFFDTATGAYMRPFFAQADAQAVREFSNLVMDADHPFSMHPKDYSICRIGVFDDQSGELVPEPVQYLATGLEMVAAARKVDREQLQLFEKKVNGGNKDAPIDNGA